MFYVIDGNVMCKLLGATVEAKIWQLIVLENSPGWILKMFICFLVVGVAKMYNLL